MASAAGPQVHIPEMIVKRDGRAVPFHRQKIVSAVYRAAVACGGRDLEEAERVADLVLSLLVRRGDPRSWPTVEEVQDLVERALIERGHARTAKAYIVYRYERALKRARRESLTYSSDNIPYRKLWEALSWSIDHGCVTLEQLSGLAAEGRFAELVRASDAFYERELDGAVGRIIERRKELRVIIVAGPSASGKSTTVLRIKERLSTEGINVVPLTVDHYFFDRTTHPRMGEDDYDFETPQALDLELVARHLSELVAGRTVVPPRYDFIRGCRSGQGVPLSLPPGSLLLLDSLHGLFPDMTAGLPEETKFRLYVETLSQVKASDGRFIRWADVRMLRRMVRDTQFRGTTPHATLVHWPLVRRAELRYIVPELRRAHALVNSFLPYELAVLKARIHAQLVPLVEELRQMGGEQADAYERAVRAQALLEQVVAVTDEGLVPTRSLLREFIGGGDHGERVTREEA